MSSAPPARKGHSPLLLILLGFVCLFFWILATMFEIQTSEAFILGLPVSSFSPAWGIFMQPIDYINGGLSPIMAKAMMWGWGVEIIYLVCVIAFTVIYEVMGRSHSWVARAFGTGAIAIIILNAWSNFQYGTLPSGFWGQVGFALITAFVTAFFGIAGVRLIEVAVTNMRA